MLKKNKILILSIILLSAACGSSPPTNAGIVKTVNGGGDWQFTNHLVNGTTTSLAGLQVSSMSLDPQNRQTIFSAGYNGGLYKSEDAGANWSKILSGTKIFVYDFAINPLDSKTIYAVGSFAGNGKVVKTIDGGTTWQEVYNEGSSGSVVRNIALNANSPEQIIIGTQSGNVIKSLDGGKNWQLVKNFNDQINKVLWQQTAVYVLVKTQGIYKSTDGGQTFLTLSGSLPKQSLTDFVSDGAKIIGVFSQAAVSMSNPAIIYLTTDKGLQKTTDEGKTWTQVKLPIKMDQSVAKAIAIARESDSIVFTSVASTIYKTLDSGVTWQTQKIPTTGFINYIVVDPQLAQISYAGIYGQ